MKKIILKEVEHIYCDVCGKYIKGGTYYGFTMPNGDYWDVCGGYGEFGVEYLWQLPKVNNVRYQPLSCKQKVELKIAIESADRYCND